MSQDGFKLNLPPPPEGQRTIRAEMPVAKAGTLITCPKCRAHIGRLRRTLYHSLTVAADSIIWEPGQHHDHDEGAICKKCGATYMAITASIKQGRRILLHTQVGWI